MKQLTRHIQGPLGRTYLNLTPEQWEEYDKIRKDNPDLTEWECRELQLEKANSQNNTNQSPEETKDRKPMFRQPTPEESRIMDEQMEKALKIVNENMKAGRWMNERDYQK